MAIIKLGNKLPRISLPAALPNGDTVVPWSKDPYIESAVYSAPWVTRIGLDPTSIRNTGWPVVNSKNAELQINAKCYL